MLVKIFFCYAHEDEELLNNLKKHLWPSHRQGLIDIWHDRDISAGMEWEHEISQHLNAAHIILLLVSPDFTYSEYCYSIEMKRAIERHERGEARVMPLILRSIDWKGTPFGKLQALPTDGKPVISSAWHDWDEAFLDVAMGIRKVVKELTRSCDLFCYDRRQGEGKFYSIDAYGNIEQLEQHAWQTTWTHIIPGNFTGSKYTDLLFYSSLEGKAKFFSTDGYGNINQIKEHPIWRTSWNCLVPGNFTRSKYTDLLFYDAEAGEGEFFTTNGQGEIHSLIRGTDWSKTWTHIIPGNFTGSKYTDLLFYSSSTGALKFFSTDGYGNINQIKDHYTWRKNCSQFISLKPLEGKVLP
jgi:hypothetical protein